MFQLALTFCPEQPVVLVLLKLSFEILNGILIQERPLFQYEKMKKHHIRLTVEDRTRLNGLIARGHLKPRGVKRAAALLALDEGKLYKEVAAELGVTSTTVSAWAQKYKKKGLGFLKDKPRKGRPRRITSRQKEKIVALAQSEPPHGHERWSLRLLAEKAIALGYVNSISHQYINQILKENELSIF